MGYQSLMAKRGQSGPCWVLLGLEGCLWAKWPNDWRIEIYDLILQKKHSLHHKNQSLGQNVPKSLAHFKTHKKNWFSKDFVNVMFESGLLTTSFIFGCDSSPNISPVFIIISTCQLLWCNVKLHCSDGLNVMRPLLSRHWIDIQNFSLHSKFSKYQSSMDQALSVV